MLFPRVVFGLKQQDVCCLLRFGALGMTHEEVNYLIYVREVFTSRLTLWRENLLWRLEIFSQVLWEVEIKELWLYASENLTLTESLGQCAYSVWRLKSVGVETLVEGAKHGHLQVLSGLGLLWRLLLLRVQDS